MIPASARPRIRPSALDVRAPDWLPALASRARMLDDVLKPGMRGDRENFAHVAALQFLPPEGTRCVSAFCRLTAAAVCQDQTVHPEAHSALPRRVLGRRCGPGAGGLAVHGDSMCGVHPQRDDDLCGEVRVAQERELLAGQTCLLPLLPGPLDRPGAGGDLIARGSLTVVGGCWTISSPPSPSPGSRPSSGPACAG